MNFDDMTKEHLQEKLFELFLNGRLPKEEEKDIKGFKHVNLDSDVDFKNINLSLFGDSEPEADKSEAEKIEQANEMAEQVMELISKELSFSTIRQGNGTNKLTKLRASKDKGLTIDSITGEATIKSDDFAMKIAGYTNLTGLRTSTYQLFDAITIAFTESGAKSPTVILPLETYMMRRGLKNRKEAKAQACEDLNLLSVAQVCWEEKRGNETRSYKFMNLADSGEIHKNGDIVFTYGATFYKILLGYPVMSYPPQLQTLDSRKNPNSYYLLRKIAELKNMNVGKDNENIISVKTLLKSAPYLPTYQTVMKGNKNLTSRIITPFERDMDALNETLTWHYCHKLNTELTEDELENMNYEIFENLLVYINWREYPDQTKRLEKRAERQSGDKKKKKSSKKDVQKLEKDVLALRKEVKALEQNTKD